MQEGKKDRKFRKKRGRDEDDGASKEVGEEDDKSLQSGASDASVEKRRKKKKSKSMLSFGDEEGEEAAVVIKSKARPDLRHKHTPGQEGAKQERARAFMGAAHQVDYGADAMRELRAQTKRAIVVKGKSPAVVVDTGGGGGEQPPSIPDAATIRAARERRERLRQLGERAAADNELNSDLRRREMERGGSGNNGDSAQQQQDFIPLNASDPLASAASLASSRLHRPDHDEDDDVDAIARGESVGESSGHRKRVSFDPAVLQQQRKSEIMAALSAHAEEAEEEENDEDVDDSGGGDGGGHNSGMQRAGPKERGGGEFSEWEIAQLRKAGVQARPQALPKSGGGAGARSSGVFDNLVPIESLEATEKRLRARVQEMKDVHQAHRQELDELEGRLANGAAGASSFNSDLEAINKRYAFFQRTRDHIVDLLCCLDAKVPEIDAYLDKVRDVRRRRRRHQHEAFVLRIADEFDELGALLKGAVAPRMKKDNSHGEDDHHSGSGSDSDNERSGDDNEGGVDAFGRDRGFATTAQRRARREKRRKRQMQRRREASHQDGLSSESEGGSDGEYWENEHERVLEAAKHVMDEVDDDFRTVAPIKKTLEEWKLEQPQSYKDSYVSICLPTLFSPFIKVELLAWNPLDRPTIEDFEWYNALFDYGMRDGDLPEDDPDNDLVPRLVQFVVVPFLTQCISDSFNPFSNKHNTNLVALVTELLNYVGPTTPEFKALLLEVFRAMQESLNMFSVPQVVGEHEEALEFSRWCFVKSTKLLRNVAKWRRILSVEVLQGMTMDKLITQKQLPYIKHLQSLAATVEAVELVVHTLPREWLGAQAKLEPLRSHLTKCVGRQTPPGDPLATGRAVKLLTKLGDNDSARAISQRFGLHMV